MTITKQELIERWDSGEDKPFKGGLIDWDAYQSGGGAGCMCAQGQALHLLGGWTPEKLKTSKQRDADIASAKLLNIPIAQAILLRFVNDEQDGAPSIVLTNPKKVIGDHAELVIRFWWHLDGISNDDWAKATTEWSAAWNAAVDAAWNAAGVAAGYAAWNAAGYAAGNAAGVAARNATWEIQGHENLESLFFLPMFGIESIEQLRS